jgi:hypothetical protein
MKEVTWYCHCVQKYEGEEPQPCMEETPTKQDMVLHLRIVHNSSVRRQTEKTLLGVGNDILASVYPRPRLIT